jgi:two-component system phosphate regulon response regulator OmpR
MRNGSSEGSAATDVSTPLLIVEDDEEMRDLLKEALSDEGYLAEAVPDGAQALIRLRSETFAAIVLDQRMPGLSGLAILPGVKTICPDTPVILITAFGDDGTRAEALEKGASACLLKPFPMEELFRAVRHALATRGGRVPAARPSGTPS